MNALSAPRRLTTVAAARSLLLCAAITLVLSCGGGGGGSSVLPTERPEGVYTGFSATGDLNWELTTGDGGSVGGGADGDGGVGAGGDFGQFRNAVLIVKYPDGSPVGNGQALTDANSGMVTIQVRKGYQGPLYLELRGGAGATYYEEGKNTFVDFPAGQVIRAIVPAINKNIGITPFSEAAYRLLTEGSTAERASNPALPTASEISKANGKVLGILNRQFPATLSVDDITRLPFIKSNSIGPNSISIDPRGRYGLVNGAFSKQAAMYNATRAQPTLDAVAQLGTDLLDGVLDGMNGNQPAVAAGVRTYDPNTLTGELSSALAEQSFRFGDNAAQLALPKVLNFANSRYEGYLFDASLTREGKAIDTVSGWVGDNAKNFSIGQSFDKLPAEARVFGVFGNLGHGSLYFKTNALNSQSKIYVVGDNVNGELGLGNSTKTAGQALEITLPGVLTHVAGGFAHTVARMADGSVFTWGDNSFGQLGTGNALGSTIPVAITLPRGAVAVAATNTASYALLDDGSVYAWGSSGGFGLLGDGNKNSVSSTPTPITALSGVVQITGRDNDVAVLRRDGSVWHWGSFPSDDAAFSPGDVTTPYAGGTPLPTQLLGLPAGVGVRKILTEQGVFAALLADGAVYEWGVYFDITAGTILRDIEARRVLNVPPLRDIMPGGFIGYGVRPFDRLTAMGIDYRGGMWKIRGRVAEQFDPANPTQQRRPQGQAPRPDCASCHLFLTDWPLTPAAPTTTDVCLPPPDIHGAGATSLIHAETECQMCHNPARIPPAAAFPNGWLSCVKPTNLPQRSNPIAPPIVTTACTIPVVHAFTPPGTVCATCHNSIIARPLQDLGCAQPPSSGLPSIKTTATVVTALNDLNATIPAGSSTTDTTPLLQGTLSAALQAGQSLRALRNGGAVGLASVTGTSWTYTDAGASTGPQAYSVRVEAGTAFGPTSNSYAIMIDTVAPVQTTTVALSDDINPGFLPEPGFTSDSTPIVSGTLSAALATGESVRVLRGGTTVATLAPTSTSWTYTETAALAGGTYIYTARVVDAAGNSGPLSTARTLTVVTNLPAVTISTAVNDQGVPIASASSTADGTPALQGTISAGLGAGQLVRILRDGTAIGTATVTTTNWTFTDPGTLDGAHTYTARSEQGTVFSAASAGYTFTVDTVAPTQTANVTGIADDISGALANGASTSDTTPTVSGTLSAVLGAGESVRLLRNGAQVGAPPVSVVGTAWSYTEQAPGLAQATYTYQTQVVDAAGNSSAPGSTRSVTVNTTVPLPGAATTIATVNGAAPSGGAVAVSNDSTPTLAGTVQRSLLGDEHIRIYRDLVPVAAVTTATTSWSYVSPALGTGTYSFRAQVEKILNAATNGLSSANVSVPIDVTAPTQTFQSITATSSVTPNSTVSGAVPASDVISGTTNDPSPTITIVLSSGLGSGEALNVTRAVGAAAATTVATFTSASACSPSGRCFQFTDSTAGVSIPTPPARRADTLTAATTPNASLPTASYTYAARVTDGVGNLGSNSGNVVAFAFNYFNCDQNRANTTYASQFPGFPHSTLVSALAAPTANCASCHRSQQANQSAATPAGTFIAVPRGDPAPALASSYWCRRPN